jgi:hypothetical protein
MVQVDVEVRVTMSCAVPMPVKGPTDVTEACTCDPVHAGELVDATCGCGVAEPITGSGLLTGTATSL